MARRIGSRLIRRLLNLLSVIAAIGLLFSYLAPFVNPDSFPLIPFFGLAYPLIVLVFIGLLLLQVFFHRWWALGMLVMLLAGWNLHFRAYSIGENVPNSTNVKSLKIMSYNVHLFDVYNEKKELANETRVKIIQYLENESPDIVCFQEFYQQDQPTSFTTKDTIISLLGYKNYQERYAHRISGRQNFGIALFSKYPIVEKGEVRFTPKVSSSNFAIYSDIVFQADTFRVYNVHLQSIRLNPQEKAVLSSEESKTGLFDAVKKVLDAFPERAHQSNRLIRHIASSPHPVVVCGDFNDTPLSYTYQRFHNVLTDAFTESSSGIGKTYAGKIPAGRIDYIFHSESLGAHSFEIQEKALSDHYAIHCEIFAKKN